MFAHEFGKHTVAKPGSVTLIRVILRFTAFDILACIILITYFNMQGRFVQTQ